MTLNHLLKPEVTKLKNDLIMFLFYQILRGLKYLHSCNIIHRVTNNFIIINLNSYFELVLFFILGSQTI